MITVLCSIILLLLMIMLTIIIVSLHEIVNNIKKHVVSCTNDTCMKNTIIMDTMNCPVSKYLALPLLKGFLNT